MDGFLEIFPNYGREKLENVPLDFLNFIVKQISEEKVSNDKKILRLVVNQEEQKKYIKQLEDLNARENQERQKIFLEYVDLKTKEHIKMYELKGMETELKVLKDETKQLSFLKEENLKLKNENIKLRSDLNLEIERNNENEEKYKIEFSNLRFKYDKLKIQMNRINRHFSVLEDSKIEESAVFDTLNLKQKEIESEVNNPSPQNSTFISDSKLNLDTSFMNSSLSEFFDEENRIRERIKIEKLNLEKEIEDLKLQVESVTEVNDNLKNQINSLKEVEDLYKQSLSKINVIENERTDLFFRNKELQNQILYLLSENTDGMDNASKHSSTSKIMEKNQELIKMVQSFSKRIFKLEEELKNTLREKNEKEEILSRIKQEQTIIPSKKRKSINIEDIPALDTIQSSLVKLSESLTSLNFDSKEVQKENKSLKEENLNLKKENESLFSRNLIYESEISEAKKKIKENNESIKTKNEEIRFLIMENDSLKMKNDILMVSADKLKNSTEENLKNSIIIKDNKKKIEEMSKLIQEQEARYNNILLYNPEQRRYGALINSINRLNSQNLKNIDVINNLKANFEELCVTYKSLKDEENAFRSEIARIKDKHKTKMLNQEKDLLSRFEQEKELIKTNYKNLESKLNKMEELDEENLHLKEKVEELTKIISMKEDYINQWLSENQDMALSILGKERKMLTEEVGLLKEKISNLGDADLCDENLKLKQKCELYYAENKKLLEEISEKKYEIINFKRTMDDIQNIKQENVILNENLINLNSQLEQKSSLLEKYMLMVEKLKKVKDAYLKLKSTLDLEHQSQQPIISEPMENNSLLKAKPIIEPIRAPQLELNPKNDDFKFRKIRKKLIKKSDDQ